MRTIGASDRNSWRADAALVDLTRSRRDASRVTIAARPQDLTVDLSRCACIVVDMQNDFCSRGGWLDHIGVDISPARRPIAPLQTTLPALRSAGVPVLWLNWGNRADRANLPPGVLHVYDPDGESLGIGDSIPASGSRVLEAGSWSVQVVDELDVAEIDIRVDKYRMSGFFDTPLDSVLRNLDTTTLLFAGVNVDQCVLATLTDAACIGYDVVLLEDCSATTSPQWCQDATIYNVAQCYGFVSTGAALLAGLGATSPSSAPGGATHPQSHTDHSRTEDKEA
jgi:nicotinamidase-related amidase